MSKVRACSPCRVAKTKCDRVSPVCGRCQQRGLTCSGIPAEIDFMFRDENETSQRNSERARRLIRDPRIVTTLLDVLPSQLNQERMISASSLIPDPGLRNQYPWLNDQALVDISESQKIDLETRALDRFFVNWTLYPLNDGASPGYMYDLHMLYLSAPPDSVLWLAVRAIAFADMKHESTGDTDFYVKSRKSYGAALSSIRAAAQAEQELTSDHFLAAILLIDSFELMYLAQTEPLGPHRDAIKHILRTGGNEQLLNKSRFALWCVAHHRLQFRQTLLREEPDPEQIVWVSKLNIDRPDIHICADFMRMNILSAAMKKLIQDNETDGTETSERIAQATRLAHKCQELNISIHSWTSEISDAWKPKITDLQHITQPTELNDPQDLPMPHFPCPRLLIYRDIWLAYMWNCHGASQIVFRESLIDIISYRATLKEQDPSIGDLQLIKTEREAVERLSTAIIQSFPTLLGFTHRKSRETHSSRQGRMAGRFFSIFPLWVIQRAQFTPDHHKNTASEVTKWISSRHGLR